MVGLSRARAIVVEGQGSTYVTGRTSLPYPITTGAFDRASNGGFDTFVTKLNPTASALAYSTFLGGANSDEAFGIALDGEGNAYVTGQTVSADYPTTTAAMPGSGESRQSMSDPTEGSR